MTRIPERSSVESRRAESFAIGALGLGALGCCLLVALTAMGAIERPIAKVSAAIVAAHDDWENVEPHFPAPDPLILPGTSDERVIFLGDSQMEQYAPRVLWLYRTQKPVLTSVFATAQGCAPLPDTGARGDAGRFDCDTFFRETIRRVEAPNVRKVVISAAWGKYFPSDIQSDYFDRTLSNFSATVSAMVGRGIKVYVILSSPSGRQFDTRRMPRWRMLLGGTAPDDASVDRASVRPAGDARLMNPFSAAVTDAGARLIDPFDYICDGRTCPTVIDGKPTHQDEGHLRASIARKWATFLDEIVMDAPNQRPSP